METIERTKGKGTDFFSKSLHFLLGMPLFFSLTLLSCSEERGNWTAVQQEARYIYGVWHSTTEEKAQKAILEIRSNIKNASAALEPSTAKNTGRTDISPTHLLPSDRESGGWVQSRLPSTYEGETLYRDRSSSPKLYYAYGFQRQAEVEYETPRFGSKPLILLEIFDMGSPENAFGIYNFYTYPQMKIEWVGCKALLSGNYLRFSKGKYFVQIEGYEIATSIREGMVALAKIVAAQIEDPPRDPRIFALLPSSNKVNGSVKLFRSNWTLRQIYSSLPTTIPQLTDTAIGISSRYWENMKSETWLDTPIVFIIRFADSANAESAYTDYRDSVTNGKAVFEVGSNGAILINESPTP